MVIYCLNVAEIYYKLIHRCWDIFFSTSFISIILISCQTKSIFRLLYSLCLYNRQSTWYISTSSFGRKLLASSPWVTTRRNLSQNSPLAFTGSRSSREQTSLLRWVHLENQFSMFNHIQLFICMEFNSKVFNMYTRLILCSDRVVL